MKFRISFFAVRYPINGEEKMSLKVLGAIAVALVVGGALMVSAPKSAQALPAYAAQTGKACGACHQNPAGGGPRNAFGEAFAANGHKLPAKK
jgi:mono/diheme cytochrome c family protein